MVDLDELERLEREATPGPWEWNGIAIEAGRTDVLTPGESNSFGYGTIHIAEEDKDLIAALRNAAPAMIAELRTLRARVAEIEEENERLRWAVRASCVRTPTPGCECPGCETARERAAQADLVDSYEAELEEDRQAERDRILGARVREVMEAHGTNPERFISEWCRAQAEYETELEGGSDG